MAVTVMQPFEPKATNRFIMYVGGILTNIPAYVIKATTLPSIDQDEIKIRYINSSFKVKGLSEWQDIDITLYDPIHPSAAAHVRNWVMHHHLSLFGIDGYAFGYNPNNFLSEPFGQIAEGGAFGGLIDSPLGYKKNIDIKYLAPNGQETEGWKLIGAYIKNANWGELDWSRGDALEIKLTLAYDYAILL